MFELKLNKGDLSIKNGKLEVLVGSDKLIQELLKICLTDVGGNPLNPWYGSYISKSLVGNVLDDTITESVCSNQIKNTINTFMELQNRQLQDPFLKISADELLSGIRGVSVQRNQRDWRLFTVLVSVVTKSFNLKTLNFNISA